MIITLSLENDDKLNDELKWYLEGDVEDISNLLQDILEPIISALVHTKRDEWEEYLDD